MSHFRVANFYDQLVRGNLGSGETFIHKYGRNPDIDTADGFEDIWGGGGHYTGQDATAAETVEVFSSDVADDDTTGTGAWTVRVWGLDASWASQTEDVILDGTTAVDTANTYIRMDRMQVLTAGTGAINAGTLTARQKTTTANVFIQLPIGYGQTMIACWSTPADTSSRMHFWGAGISNKTNGSCNVRLMMRSFGGVWTVKEEWGVVAGGTGLIPRVFELPKNGLAGKTDIKISADAGANNMAIAGAFDMTITSTA